MQPEADPSAALPLVSTPREARPAVVWHPWTRAGFRFVCVYLFLYNFPFPIGAVPYTNWLSDKYTLLWQRIVPWVGKHILHLREDITVFTNGSGDTTFDYVNVLCYLAIAMVSAAVWTALDGKRSNYETLHRWLRVYVRLSLATAMVAYGMFKIIPSQFPAPGLSRLAQPYGDSSPMGLLWTFMGASMAYTIFAGSAEALAGVLLFIPRLATLGGLAAIAVLTNVFMLNMCYDVPVKLYSFNLLMMAVFLVAPDARRLVGLLVLRERVELHNEGSLFERKRFNQVGFAVQLLLGAVLIFTFGKQSWKQRSEFAAKPPHYGMWSVDEYVVDGQAHPALMTDTARWRRVFLEYDGYAALLPMSGPRQSFLCQVDAAKKTITLGKRENKNWKSVLTLDDSKADTLLLKGEYDGHQLAVKLVRENPSTFLLANRGFHWINEFPFNR